MTGLAPETILAVVVVGLLAISATSEVSRRTGVATPLLLVALGIGVGFIPGMPPIDIEPEWILAGVLPPLVYAAAVSMPPMNFRREFRSIASLSVTLVVLSSLALGGLFAWALSIPFAWGVALGAVVSPTDAVAVAIARRAGVPQRVLTILEGEGLLNDATALVLLRAAVAAGAASISFGQLSLDFLYAVAVAVTIGFALGHAVLWCRRRIDNPAASTVVSFTAPLVAALPAELLGGSGLVAAVVAGLVAGQHAPRVLSPRTRLFDRIGWSSVELCLEGLIFLLMGLQLHTLVVEVAEHGGGVGLATWVALAGLALVLVIRALYVGLLIISIRRRTNHAAMMQPRLEQISAAHEQRMAQLPEEFAQSERFAERLDQVRVRLRRERSKVNYLLRDPLGAKEGAIIAWAGMRGAVSVAAAQTLPEGTPSRSLLVLIAFLLAGGSLLLQGTTLSALAARLRTRQPEQQAERERAEHAELLQLLSLTASAEQEKELPRSERATALAVLRAQRDALLDARDDGTFDGEMLSHALTAVDAQQISLELQGNPEE